MTPWAWIATGLAVWFAVAVVVGVIFGRTIRARDRQIPRK